MQLWGSGSGGRADKKPISESPLQENGKFAHHPAHPGSVSIIEATEKIFTAVL